MNIGTSTKAKATTIVDIILELCFSGNEVIWDRRSEERKLLEKIRRGDGSIEKEGSAYPALVKAFQGFLLAAFCVFPGIANSAIKVNSKIKDEVLNITLEKGKPLKLDIGSWSKSVNDLSTYYKQKVLGWDKPTKGFDKEDWQGLRDIFKYSKLRLEGEKTFLESLIGYPKKIITIISDPTIKMDSLLIVLAALPTDQLSAFFIEIAQEIPEHTTAMNVDGTMLDVRNYFAQSSVDTENLFKKVRILLMMYGRHEIFIDHVLVEKIRELLIKYLDNDTVRKETLTQVEKTIFGQYQPRLDIAKALAKLLS